MTLDIDRLEQLERAATKGPWDAEPIGFGSKIRADGGYAIMQPCIPYTSEHYRTHETANSELIAALRNAAPALIAAARERDALRAVADAAKWFMHCLHGVGRSGGPPESGETDAASEALRSSLAAIDRALATEEKT